MLEDIFYIKMHKEIEEVRARMAEDELRYEKLKEKYANFFNKTVKDEVPLETNLATE